MDRSTLYLLFTCLWCINTIHVLICHTNIFFFIRIVSQLLSELDDLQSQEESQVFIMGATNRADLLDQALLSPGRYLSLLRVFQVIIQFVIENTSNLFHLRFDKIINIAPGQDIDSKRKILEAVSRSVQLDRDVDMEQVVIHLIWMIFDLSFIGIFVSPCDEWSWIIFHRIQCNNGCY